jgi:hypothetical protein
LLDRARPGGQGDFVVDLEDVGGLALGVEGGAFVVDLPAAVVLGDGVDDRLEGRWRGEKGVADASSQLAGQQGVVVLGYQYECICLLAADHADYHRRCGEVGL